MKNSVKPGILVFLLFLGTESFAQIFGIKAGLNLSNILAKDDDVTYSDDFKMNPGFHIGPTVEFSINELFAFESGLLLSTKGTKISEKETYMDETWSYSSKVNLLYLDIPLTAKANFDIGSLIIYGTFGPYIGMGISGKTKYEYTGNGETETDEEDINFGSDEDDLKRLDYGITAGAGMEFNAIQIGITYSLGLANISNYADEVNKACNRVLGISVGYKFGKL